MKILVVDDEKLLVKGMKFNLENEGYEVMTAYDGAAAVELEKKENFDLIVMDVMMPGLSGSDACMKIREFSDVPVIMLTARSEDSDKLMGFACGADDYVTKPFNILELKARIRALLRRSMNGNQAAQSRQRTPLLTVGDLSLDTEQRVALRDGKTMGTYEISDLDEHEISRLMVGREVSLDIEKAEADFGKTVFSVKDLVYADQFGKTRLDHVSFSIKEGQILGIAGIDGNGQSELVEAIVGTLKLQGGQVRLNGEDLTGASVLKRQEAGISHVSEDRMRYGSAPKLSLEDNAISKVYYTGQLKSRGLIDSKKVNGFANRILKEFLVKYDNSKQSVSELSAGNVQKLIVGREFDYDPDLLIMNQPTRGIDVGAIEFIRKKIVDMRARKKAILLVSADLSEILSLSDTILVMHEGRIVGHISDVKNTSENDLGLYMLGVKEDSKEQIGGAYCE